jgi:RNA polymerase sigma factor (sigma-70 family)
LDDDAAVCRSLEALFSSVGLRARGFGSPADLLAELTPDAVGCLVLDVRLPRMSGLELQTQLAAKGVSLPVIVITGHADVPTAVRAMHQGAVDFVEKPFNEQKLLERVHACIEADVELKRQKRDAEALLRRLDTLTERERQVLREVICGASSKAIAETLGISPKTVDVHRARIVEKLHCRSTADVIRIAYEAKPFMGASAWASLLADDRG